MAFIGRGECASNFRSVALTLRAEVIRHSGIDLDGAAEILLDVGSEIVAAGIVRRDHRSAVLIIPGEKLRVRQFGVEVGVVQDVMIESAIQPE